MSLSGITQFYIDTGGEEWKFETLTDIFASVCVPQTVVFVNTRRQVDWLAERLKRDGFTVTAAHGDMDQGARDSVMKQFRAGRRYVNRFFRVLITGLPCSCRFLLTSTTSNVLLGRHFEKALGINNVFPSAS